MVITAYYKCPTRTFLQLRLKITTTCRRLLWGVHTITPSHVSWKRRLSARSLVRTGPSFLFLLLKMDARGRGGPPASRRPLPGRPEGPYVMIRTSIMSPTSDWVTHPLALDQAQPVVPTLGHSARSHHLAQPSTCGAKGAD